MALGIQTSLTSQPPGQLSILKKLLPDGLANTSRYKLDQTFTLLEKLGLCGHLSFALLI